MVAQRVSAIVILCFCTCASAQIAPNTHPSSPTRKSQSFTEDEVDRLWQRASAMFKKKRFPEAEQLCRSALAVCETTYGPEHLKTADAVSSLAVVLHQSGRRDEAESLFDRVRAIREKKLGPTHPDVAATLDEMALLAVDRLDINKALDLASRALKMRVESLGSHHRDVANSTIMLAEIAHVASRTSREFRKREGQPYRMAVSFYERTIEVFAKSDAPDDAKLAECLSNLAVAYTDQERYAKADAAMTRALRISERLLPPDSAELARRYDQAAAIRKRARRDAHGRSEARELNARARAIRAKADRSDGRAPSLAQRLGLAR